MQANASRPGDSFQCPDLLEQEKLQPVRVDWNGAPAKIVASPRAWMSPQAHAELLGEAHAPVHRFRIAGMPAASHVRRCDAAHQRPRSRRRFAFA